MTQLLHPAHLHAQASIWSLDRAMTDLAEAVRQETHALDGDRGTLQAWRPNPMAGLHSAIHRDLGDALLDASRGANRYDRRYRNTTAVLCWLSAKLLGDRHRADLPPLAQLKHGLFTIPVPAMAELTKWLDEQDRKVREVLDTGDDHRLIPGATCPACDRAGVLAFRTSAPREAWVMICTAPTCRCYGPEACLCLMGLPSEGTRHIWTRDDFDRARQAQKEAA